MEPFDHLDYYYQALHTMAANAEAKFVRGWMQYAREKHQALYEKYRAALKQIHELWGKQDPESIEAWKRVVQVEVDGTKYFIDRYQEYIEENPPFGDDEDLSKEGRDFEVGTVQSIGIEVVSTAGFEETAQMMHAHPEIEFELVTA